MSRIKPQSEKRISEQAVRRDIAFHYDQERCWLSIEGVCTGRAQAWHELVGAGQGGSRSDHRNLCAACNACNKAVEDNPLVSRSRGWKVPSTEAMEGEGGLVPRKPNPYSLAERWT